MTGDVDALVGVPATKIGVLADWLALIAAGDRERVQTRFDERVRGQGEADTMTYLVQGPGGTALADSKLSLTMRGLAPKQRVSVFVNEKPVGTLDVDTATKTYDVAVPAAALVVGDNRVRLTFKSAANLPGGKRAAAALKLVTLGPAALAPARCATT